MHILITGGAGYIGSHTVLECLNAGHTISVIDNLVNASRESLKRVEKLSHKKVTFYKAGIEDKAILDHIFKAQAVDAVIHFAALKAVGESCEKPLLYYHNNVAGTLILLEAMQRAGVQRFIFSSSATVYGDPLHVPVDENTMLQSPMSPYGAGKVMVERMITDLVKAHPPFQAVLLRYFNPAGAHVSGEIGEDPHGTPNNLTPYLTQVAIKKRPFLSIFGQDYPTPDGTCIRDYIHVVDLAQGHLAALNALERLPPISVYNLGTGQGHSVLELVHTFEAVTGVKIPYTFVERRAGDVPVLYAHVEKARRDLQWKTHYTLADMLAHAWKWQQQNPNGYYTF